MSGAGLQDFYCREAQRLGYVARSAFKLLQMQKQFKLIGAGDSVLDLGCAPGAWLQVACQSLGPLEKGGAVVGVDLKKVNVPSHHCDSRVKTVCADVMNLRMVQARAFSPQGLGFSVILSDMCPLISGITTKDATLSCELGKRALSLALGNASSKNNAGFLGNIEDSINETGVLQRRGNIVIKLLESEDTEASILLNEGWLFQTLPLWVVGIGINAVYFPRAEPLLFHRRSHRPKDSRAKTHLLGFRLNMADKPPLDEFFAYLIFSSSKKL